MDSNARADARRGAAAALAALLTVAGSGALDVPAALAAALLVVILALACVSPLGVTAAAVGSLPYFYHPLVFGSQRLAASEILLAAAVAGTVMRGLFAVLTGRWDWRASVRSVARDRAALTLLLVAGALALLGVLYLIWPYDADHRAETLREWRWTLAEPVVLIALLVCWARGEWQRRFIALALLAGAGVASLHGLTDLWQGGGLAVEGVRRISGPYPHPNALALYLSRCASFGIAWWLFERRARVVLTPLVVVCVVALVASFSRGALVAVGIAVLLLALRLRPAARLSVAGGVVVLGAAVLVLARERMTDLFSGGSGTLRIEIWRSTIAMIRDRPVWGYGPDQFLYAYLPRYVTPSNWAERFTSHPHNILLDFWVRLGIIGAAFALFVACFIVARAVGMVRLGGPTDPLGAASSVALIALVAHGMVDRGYFTHDLALSAWLLVSFAVVAPVETARKGSDEFASAGRRRRRVHWFSLGRQLGRRGS